MSQQGYTIISHNADNGGCSFYRMRMQNLAAQTLRKDFRIIESTKFIAHPQFFQDVRLVRIQRQISNEQTSYILNFLKPLAEKIGFYIAFEIDDVIGMNDIPKYNSGWEAYQNPQFMENVRQILKACDYVTVTTDELANYYIKTFGASREQMLVIPNYIPRWWMDGIYDIEKIERRYDKNQQKPRICFASSTTHFDIFNRTNGVDDFTHIIPFIERNIDKYQFVFIGGVPQQLNKYIPENKLECHRGFDILNYPKEVNKLNIDLVIAPLIDNVFNKCKSAIKFGENAAMGIPVMCQNLVTYKGHTDKLFNNDKDLEVMVENLLSNKSEYMNEVIKNRNVVDFGNKMYPRGWWLENNLDKWFEFFSIPQRTLRLDIRQKINEQSMPTAQPMVIDLSK